VTNCLSYGTIEVPKKPAVCTHARTHAHISIHSMDPNLVRMTTGCGISHKNTNIHTYATKRTNTYIIQYS